MTQDLILFVKKIKILQALVLVKCKSNETLAGCVMVRKMIKCSL